MQKASAIGGQWRSGSPENKSLHIENVHEGHAADGPGSKDEKSDLVVCFGEMLIDLVLTLSGYLLVDAPSFKKAPGGAPANVAVAIFRLGGHSGFIGKVGDNKFGHMLIAIQMHHGVDSTGVRFDANAQTALAFVTLREDGEREFMLYRNPSPDMLLQELELNIDIITKASIFCFGSISLIAKPCKSAHLAAKKSGMLLSYSFVAFSRRCKEGNHEHLA
ncbi:hypothetical protein L7F22_056723 [Adiantum nelumboides]|nr:hypothetical protein [Adiantum nelumboides]